MSKVSEQKFTSEQREAIWVAHAKKCAYTREPIEFSNFHIDHVIPEKLIENPVELSKVLARFSLPKEFNVLGYENLLPCKPGVNLQKHGTVLDDPHIHYFLGIAQAKKEGIEKAVSRIEKRKNKGRALMLLQRCLEKAELSPLEVVDILDKNAESPEQIFPLLEAMKFADSEEIDSVARLDLPSLRDRPLRGYSPNDGLPLVNEAGEEISVCTCNEYENAKSRGFYAYSNYAIKMSVEFEHQCSLLRAFDSAMLPMNSYVSNPTVGIHDLDKMPMTLFPCIDPDADPDRAGNTYQDELSKGTLVVRRLRQNLLQIEEPEGMGQLLIEVARADFSRSGNEEILVFEYCYATHGTLGYGGARVITRASGDSNLQEVRDAL